MQRERSRGGEGMWVEVGKHMQTGGEARLCANSCPHGRGAGLWGVAEV